MLLALTLVVMFAMSWMLVQSSGTVSTMASASPGRFRTLEGLRGLLACSVFVHHADIARATYAGHDWVAPASPLYHFAGDAAVATFFMITGLLFWDKAISGRLRFVPLMRSRWRRIVPLQAFALLLVVALCLVRGDDAARSWQQTLDGAVRWLGLGFLGEARINGVPTLHVDAGVTWSLTFEWLFYLALVPLARLCRTPRRLAVALLGLVIAILVCRRSGLHLIQHRLMLLLPFAGGMFAAYAARSGRFSARRFEGTPATCGVILLAGIVAAAYHRGYPQLLNLALIPAFVAVVLGNDLFTLLRRRCLRWLGHVSFSLYLLHGIVLLSVLPVVDRIWPIGPMDDAVFSVLVALIGAAVVGIASLSYLLIERAFLGSEPSRAVGSPPPSASAWLWRRAPAHGLTINKSH